MPYCPMGAILPSTPFAGAALMRGPRWYPPTLRRENSGDNALQAKPIPRWLGIVLLLTISVVFGSNHIAARFAFEHGSNVVTAVAFRATFALVFVFVLLVANGVSFSLSGATRLRGLVIGLFLLAQSYCIFSAVALIPVALALLAFNTYPI